MRTKNVKKTWKNFCETGLNDKYDVVQIAKLKNGDNICILDKKGNVIFPDERALYDEKKKVVKAKVEDIQEYFNSLSAEVLDIGMDDIKLSFVRKENKQIEENIQSFCDLVFDPDYTDKKEVKKQYKNTLHAILDAKNITEVDKNDYLDSTIHMIKESRFPWEPGEIDNIKEEIREERKARKGLNKYQATIKEICNKYCVKYNESYTPVYFAVMLKKNRLQGSIKFVAKEVLEWQEKEYKKAIIEYDNNRELLFDNVMLPLFDNYSYESDYSAGDLYDAFHEVMQDNIKKLYFDLGLHKNSELTFEALNAKLSDIYNKRNNNDGYKTCIEDIYRYFIFGEKLKNKVKLNGVDGFPGMKLVSMHAKDVHAESGKLEATLDKCVDEGYIYFLFNYQNHDIALIVDKERKQVIAKADSYTNGKYLQKQFKDELEKSFPGYRINMEFTGQLNKGNNCAMNSLFQISEQMIKDKVIEVPKPALTDKKIMEEYKEKLDEYQKFLLENGDYHSKDKDFDSKEFEVMTKWILNYEFRGNRDTSDVKNYIGLRYLPMLTKLDDRIKMDTLRKAEEAIISFISKYEKHLRDCDYNEQGFRDANIKYTFNNIRLKVLEQKIKDGHEGWKFFKGNVEGVQRQLCAGNKTLNDIFNDLHKEEEQDQILPTLQTEAFVSEMKFYNKYYKEFLDGLHNNGNISEVPKVIKNYVEDFEVKAKYFQDFIDAVQKNNFKSADLDIVKLTENVAEAKTNLICIERFLLTKDSEHKSLAMEAIDENGNLTIDKFKFIDENGNVNKELVSKWLSFFEEKIKNIKSIYSKMQNEKGYKVLEAKVSRAKEIIECANADIMFLKEINGDVGASKQDLEETVGHLIDCVAESNSIIRIWKNRKYFNGGEHTFDNTLTLEKEKIVNNANDIQEDKSNNKKVNLEILDKENKKDNSNKFRYAGDIQGLKSYIENECKEEMLDLEIVCDRNNKFVEIRKKGDNSIYNRGDFDYFQLKGSKSLVFKVLNNVENKKLDKSVCEGLQSDYNELRKLETKAVNLYHRITMTERIEKKLTNKELFLRNDGEAKKTAEQLAKKNNKDFIKELNNRKKELLDGDGLILNYLLELEDKEKKNSVIEAYGSILRERFRDKVSKKEDAEKLNSDLSSCFIEKLKGVVNKAIENKVKARIDYTRRYYELLKNVRRSDKWIKEFDREFDINKPDTLNEKIINSKIDKFIYNNSELDTRKLAILLGKFYDDKEWAKNKNPEIIKTVKSVVNKKMSEIEKAKYRNLKLADLVDRIQTDIQKIEKAKELIGKMDSEKYNDYKRRYVNGLCKKIQLLKYSDKFKEPSRELAEQKVMSILKESDKNFEKYFEQYHARLINGANHLPASYFFSKSKGNKKKILYNIYKDYFTKIFEKSYNYNGQFDIKNAKMDVEKIERSVSSLLKKKTEYWEKMTEERDDCRRRFVDSMMQRIELSRYASKYTSVDNKQKMEEAIQLNNMDIDKFKKYIHENEDNFITNNGALVMSYLMTGGNEDKLQFFKDYYNNFLGRLFDQEFCSREGKYDARKAKEVVEKKEKLVKELSNIREGEKEKDKEKDKEIKMKFQEGWYKKRPVQYKTTKVDQRLMASNSLKRAFNKVNKK